MIIDFPCEKKKFIADKFLSMRHAYLNLKNQEQYSHCRHTDGLPNQLTDLDIISNVYEITNIKENETYVKTLNEFIVYKDENYKKKTIERTYYIVERINKTENIIEVIIKPKKYTYKMFYCTDNKLKSIYDVPNDKSYCDKYFTKYELKEYSSFKITYNSKYRGITKGYVYLMDDINFYKIGMSINPKKRLKQIKISNAKVDLKYQIEVPLLKMNKYESQLHRDFKKFQVKGEWFYKDRSILSHFKEYNTPIKL